MLAVQYSWPPFILYRSIIFIAWTKLKFKCFLTILFTSFVHSCEICFKLCLNFIWYEAVFDLLYCSMAKILMQFRISWHKGIEKEGGQILLQRQKIRFDISTIALVIKLLPTSTCQLLTVVVIHFYCVSVASHPMCFARFNSWLYMILISECLAFSPVCIFLFTSFPTCVFSFLPVSSC